MTAAREHYIQRGRELKFESDASRESAVIVRLLEGYCECFGTALERERVYQFPAGTKAALSAPRDSCRVELVNAKEVQERLWSGIQYQELLSDLNKQRRDAAQGQTFGPRILVCGSVDTGKSTLCKYIINSAINEGHAITYTDADLGQNGITVPGTIASVFMEGKQVDIEEGFTLLLPLTFFFGDVTLTSQNVGKYHHLCKQSAACIRANAENRPQFKVGGLVVNTMGWTNGLGLTALKLIIEAFDIDTILIAGDDHQLGEALQSRYGEQAQVRVLPKQTAAVSRPSNFRKQQRGERVADYFRGVRAPLHAVKMVIPMSEVLFYQVGVGKDQQTTSKVPDYLQIARVEPDTSHHLAIVAVSHASIPEEIPHANIAGIGVVLKVDLENREITFVMPSGNPPPRRYFILSRIAVTYEEIQRY
ncbi:Protein CLP1-like protein [Diplonema papillatum]|nr:Protein CLP1-like protein [Diplonema papillatum]